MESTVDWLGLGHLATAIVALAAGLVVVLRRKGTRFHRWCGRVYAAAMLAVNVSALSIYDLFGGFGPFHVFALISLATVALGVITAVRRRPRDGWVEAHAYWMTWSYVGLVAAAVSETATRYLDFDFGLTVGLATAVVVGTGALLINRNVPRLVGRS